MSQINLNGGSTTGSHILNKEEYSCENSAVYVIPKEELLSNNIAECNDDSLKVDFVPSVSKINGKNLSLKMRSAEKVQYVCTECGQNYKKWIGQCLGCKSWNSLSEHFEPEVFGAFGISTRGSSSALKLKDIDSCSVKHRLKSGIGEFDELMGGGLMQNSVNLIGGEPGIGKSTFTLQMAHGFATQNFKVLLVSAEESVVQVKHRAARLKITNDQLWVLPEMNVKFIAEEILQLKPDVLIVDSIQTVFHENVASQPGSTQQVTAVTFELLNLSRTASITTLIIGQVTKDGYLAGPKVLEHMVDSVTMFNAENQTGLRTLKVLKNRYGSCDGVGVLEMTDFGLKPVSDLNGYFLESDVSLGNVGTCFVPVFDMQRTHMVEIQALSTKTFSGNQKRIADGVDTGRFLILVAVLEKYCNIKFSDKDLFLSISKCNKIIDKTSDLAICAALLSSYFNRPIGQKTTFLGQVTLNGSIKKSSALNQRISELNKMSFDTAVGNIDLADIAPKNRGISLQKIDKISDLLSFV